MNSCWSLLFKNKKYGLTFLWLASVFFLFALEFWPASTKPHALTLFYSHSYVVCDSGEIRLPMSEPSCVFHLGHVPVGIGSAETEQTLTLVSPFVLGSSLLRSHKAALIVSVSLSGCVLLNQNKSPPAVIS